MVERKVQLFERKLWYLGTPLPMGGGAGVFSISASSVSRLYTVSLNFRGESVRRGGSLERPGMENILKKSRILEEGCNMTRESINPMG